MRDGDKMLDHQKIPSSFWRQKVSQTPLALSQVNDRTLEESKFHLMVNPFQNTIRL